MNNDIQDSLLPLIHDTQPLTSTPISCFRDVQKHCGKDRSQVHCLGQHEDDISESCAKELSQSVPFICWRAIDKFCGVLPIGVLDCLGGHLEDLEAPCKDAVVATKHVIAKVNTQKATVTIGETKNGVKTIHAPPRSLSLPRAAAGENTASDSSADIAVPLPEKSASRKVLDSAAALVAEAEEAAKRRQLQLEAIFGQLHAESWSTPWMILILIECFQEWTLDVALQIAGVSQDCPNHHGDEQGEDDGEVSAQHALVLLVGSTTTEECDDDDQSRDDDEDV